MNSIDAMFYLQGHSNEIDRQVRQQQLLRLARESAPKDPQRTRFAGLGRHVRRFAERLPLASRVASA